MISPRMHAVGRMRTFIADASQKLFTWREAGSLRARFSTFRAIEGHDDVAGRLRAAPISLFGALPHDADAME